jgi:hypothetical protein
MNGRGSSSNFGISIVGAKASDLAPEAKTFRKLLTISIRYKSMNSDFAGIVRTVIRRI